MKLMNSLYCANGVMVEVCETVEEAKVQLSHHFVMDAIVKTHRGYEIMGAFDQVSYTMEHGHDCIVEVER